MDDEAKTEEQELEELENEILAAAEEEHAPDSEQDPEIDADPESDPEPEPEKDGDPEPEEDPEPVKEPQPDNSAYARMRHENKKLKELLAAKAREAVPLDDTVDSSMEKLVKVWETGEGDEKALLSNVRNANSKELHDIYQKAAAGKYGEHSDDVISMIQREMPMVQQREAQSRVDAEAQSTAIQRALDDELNMAKSDFPDFAKDDSDGAKFLSEFTKSVAGTLDPKTGELDGGELPEELAMYLHTHPYVMHQMADKVFKAKSNTSDASSVEVVKLQKERDSYKSRLAKYETIESPSSAPKSGKVISGDESLEDLEKQILAAGGGK